MVWNYLTDRTQRVVIPGATSRWVSINAGVPQGSTLGPLLFLVFIDDIVTVTNSLIRLFADDTSPYLIVENPVTIKLAIKYCLNQIWWTLYARQMHKLFASWWDTPPNNHRPPWSSGNVTGLSSGRSEACRGSTWPNLKLAAIFPSVPRWQKWLEHRANYYMPPTTTYMFTCMHVGKYVMFKKHRLVILFILQNFS